MNNGFVRMLAEGTNHRGEPVRFACRTKEELARVREQAQCPGWNLRITSQPRVLTRTNVAIFTDGTGRRRVAPDMICETQGDMDQARALAIQCSEDGCRVKVQFRVHRGHHSGSACRQERPPCTSRRTGRTRLCVA